MIKSGTLVLILLSLLLPLAASSARPPNILWIVAEDLSPFFGCYADRDEDHTTVRFTYFLRADVSLA
jgi:hypothetical protein